jgi:predicted esterase
MRRVPSPHAEARVIERGAELSSARGALILLHGRGGSAEEILSLADHWHREDLALLAPEASDRTWYPNSFLAPIASNEPWLSSAIELVKSLVDQCVDSRVPVSRIAIAGFSQGACLASEFVARYPKRYGALIAFTGGLIGPPGSDLYHAGSLDGTPVLLSSGDPDPHVPWSRVEQTFEEFQRMGASVQLIRYPGRQHTILAEELEAAHGLLRSVFVPSLPP